MTSRPLMVSIVFLLFSAVGCQSKEEAVKLACDSPNRIDNTLPSKERGLALANYIDQNVKNGEVLAILGSTESRIAKGKRLEAEAAKVGIEECALAELWSTPPLPPLLPASAFALPPPHPAGSGSGTPTQEQMQVIGALSVEAITEVMQKGSAAFEPCYTAGVRRDKELAGVVRARFVIDEEGKVKKAEDVDSSLSDPEVIKCILAEVEKLEFPKPDQGTVTVTFPIVLRLTK